MSAGPAIDEIPLARPVLGKAEEAAVLEVLRSRYLSLGPRVPAFEEAFAARLMNNRGQAPFIHASAVSSGTDGTRLGPSATRDAAPSTVVTGGSASGATTTWLRPPFLAS